MSLYLLLMRSLPRHCDTRGHDDNTYRPDRSGHPAAETPLRGGTRATASAAEPQCRRSSSWPREDRHGQCHVRVDGKASSGRKRIAKGSRVGGSHRDMSRFCEVIASQRALLRYLPVKPAGSGPAVETRGCFARIICGHLATRSDFDGSSVDREVDRGCGACGGHHCSVGRRKANT